MSLITTAAEAEAIMQRGNAAASRARSTGNHFNEVLKDSMSGISEDMDVIFQEAADKYDISPDLLRAVAKAESNFDPYAVSHAGAVGVMQLMPGTAKLLGVTDAYDARQNIMGGAKYLKENLDRFGDVELALAAYNAGPNSVNKYGGVPPFKETQNYVNKIMGYLEGTPLSANRTVFTGAASGRSLAAMGGSSPIQSIVPLYQAAQGLGMDQSGDTNQLLGSNQLYGMNGLYGMGGLNGMGGLVGGTSALSLMEGMSVSEDGETVSMDKASFSNLIQMLRLQMMMSAGQSVGSMFDV